MPKANSSRTIRSRCNRAIWCNTFGLNIPNLGPPPASSHLAPPSIRANASCSASYHHERNPAMCKRLILPLLLLTALTLSMHAQEGPPAGGWRGGEGGGMGAGRGVGGTVTAISGSTITIKTEDGDYLPDPHQRQLPHHETRRPPARTGQDYRHPRWRRSSGWRRSRCQGQDHRRGLRHGAHARASRPGKEDARRLRQDLDRRRGHRHQGPRHHHQAQRWRDPDSLGR